MVAALRARAVRSPWAFDSALAVALAVLGAVELAAYGELQAEAVVLAEVAVLPVAFRRVAPMAAALCVGVVLLVASLWVDGWPDTCSRRRWR